MSYSLGHVCGDHRTGLHKDENRLYSWNAAGRGRLGGEGTHDGLGVACLFLGQPSLYHSHWVSASSIRSGSAPTRRCKKVSRDGTGAWVSAGGLTLPGL